MPDMMTDKQALRHHYQILREGLSPEQRAEAEQKIYARLFSLPAWQSTPLVCGYVATRGELDLSPVWAKASDSGKSYGLPVTVTNAIEGRMIFRRLEAYTPENLISARFGISEPPPCFPALSPKDFENAVILVPGLAFDNNGFRIGYGGGYYDRFLAELTRASIHFTTVGLAFSMCRPSVLPRDSHDVAVHYIIDERRVSVPHGTP